MDQNQFVKTREKMGQCGKRLRMHLDWSLVDADSICSSNCELMEGLKSKEYNAGGCVVLFNVFT